MLTGSVPYLGDNGSRPSCFKGNKSINYLPHLLALFLWMDRLEFYSSLSCQAYQIRQPGGLITEKILVGKSNGLHHYIWQVFKIMGCGLRQCNFSPLFGLFSRFGYIFWWVVLPPCQIIFTELCLCTRFPPGWKW